ncbi:cytochrome P450 monooxygenase-like protein [Lentithecium fluviatile CBS 122367]|uniref:Cytochrome P450 monooxygenase-like protein n=1 Tax=Lentithecium fluviatile CBS 122367 TaxID=1168545 RepID=A0A6G1JEJ1_9PLEO|nr:cytochrome P450 monooxygenase-like protein [Lentithecium fluviatile CBS 122367]
MISSIISTLLVLLSLFILSSVWGIIHNYEIARKIGIPVIIVPISPENPIWMLTARHVMPLLKYVPFGNGNFTRFGYVGWQFDDKYRVHQELGDAVVFSTPAKNWIYLSNADTTHELIRKERQGEFARPVELLAMLDVFGPNLSTTNGADWQRQRKCTAASFNEQSNGLVWTESLRQGQQLLAYWKKGDKNKSSTMAQDARTLTLDVLVHAAFGKSFDFYGAREKKTTSRPLSYRDALAIILENAIPILIVGPENLKRLSFIPGLARLGDAALQFKKYMSDMFDENAEKAQDGTARGNLITSLVRASVDDKLISREEVIGNIFVYNFAGHDTTAHSFAFTFILLALNPDVQDWMSEEINHVINEDQTLDAKYDAFPRLVRTLAILLETLRLYDPLLSIVKGTQTQPGYLTIGSQKIIVPPDTRIILNLQALQSHPKYWGDDSLEWKPSRWIQTRPGPEPLFDRESIIELDHGAYIPWGEGNRSCPGKKFAQVEHVAVMVAMFRDHFVAPARLEGEGEEAARERTRSTLRDTGMVLLLQILHPEKAPLEWKARA